MGKLVTFRLKYPQVRLKSAIYTPSQDDEHSRHFYTEVSKGFTKPLIFLPIFRSFTRYFFSLNKDIRECGNVVLISKFIKNCKNFLKWF